LNEAIGFIALKRLVEGKDTAEVDELGKTTFTVSTNEDDDCTEKADARSSSWYMDLRTIYMDETRLIVSFTQEISEIGVCIYSWKARYRG
jgi:hypothetical protein